jgi:hypothetical protein
MNVEQRPDRKNADQQSIEYDVAEPPDDWVAISELERTR